MDIYGRTPPDQLFREKANEIIRLTKIEGPPFDPYVYAEYLGIDVIQDKDAPFDGTLRMLTSGKFLILLNAAASVERKRFTLAHEIAHTFYYKDLKLHMERHCGAATFDSEEERLCDIGAAELLMPSTHFGRDLKEGRKIQGSVTPQLIRTLAVRYQVSMQATCVRTVSIIKSLACIYWSKSPSINSDWATPSKYRDLVICTTGKSSVERAFRGQPSETVVANDTYYGGGDGPMRRRTVSQKLGRDTVLSVLQPLGARLKSSASLTPATQVDSSLCQPQVQYSLFSHGKTCVSP
jgi:Zn-dependent peptidase ImmA (M78 family)